MPVKRRHHLFAGFIQPPLGVSRTESAIIYVMRFQKFIRLTHLQKASRRCNKPLVQIPKRATRLKQASHHSLLTTHYSPLTTHYSHYLPVLHMQ
jgi:hypothetical protein